MPNTYAPRAATRVIRAIAILVASMILATIVITAIEAAGLHVVARAW